MHYSSNAILSKARAMYGRRLTYSDYLNMLSKKTVGEVAEYLKQHSSYSEILSKINSSTIHRGQLENFIRQKHLLDFESLCRYELSSGEHFVDYIIYSSEIELILDALIRLKSGKTEEIFIFVPSFLERQIGVDISALEKIESYDDFLYAFRNSYFYDILKRMYPADMNFDLVAFENNLYTSYYKHLLETVSSHISPKAKEEINDLFVSYIDLENLVKILRMKKFYHVSNDYILGALFPFSNVSMKTFVSMVNAETPDEVMNIAKSTRMKKNIIDDVNYPDELPERFIYKKSLHNIRYSIFPPVVMISYFNLVNNEVSNIIKIIEGIRYNIPAEKIKEMLIYSQKE